MLFVALVALAVTIAAIYGVVALARRSKTTEHPVAVVLGMVCLSCFALVGMLVTGVAGGCAALGK